MAEAAMQQAKPLAISAGTWRVPMLVALAAMVIVAVAAAWIALGEGKSGDGGSPAVSALKLEDIPFNGQRAYGYLKELCDLGPRRSGSTEMEAQQKLLAEHFRKLGGEVEFQRFRYRSPIDGSWVPMANILIRWNPKNPNRILLCAHYDTLPFPMRDPENPRGKFVGANDNASGVAILMEMAHGMPTFKSNYGIDFLLLDGEEFIFSESGRYFLGAEFFAREYAKEQAKRPPPYKYRWGVLLDMVGDTDLKLPQERNSLWWPDTKPLMADIWATAARLGVHEFVSEAGTEINDDHTMLHNIGHIPCIDIIDFDYPPWHTQGDTPDKCSSLSLAKVGWVLEEWLKTAK